MSQNQNCQNNSMKNQRQKNNNNQNNNQNKNNNKNQTKSQKKDKTKNSVIVTTERIQTLEQKGIEPYPHNFEKFGYNYITNQQFHQRFAGVVADPDSSSPEDIVAVSGRIYTVRGHGDLVFVDLGGISTSPYRLQIKINASMLYDIMKNSNIEKIDMENGENNGIEKIILKLGEIREGDMYGFTGYPCRTKRNELSMQALSVQMLAPHLRMIPPTVDDIETRYRDRALDMIVHESVRETMILRSRIIQSLRNYFFENLNLIEVETPILQIQHGGASARPFKTYHYDMHLDMFMRVAPELYLKMLVVGGIPGVFELGKQFRNESADCSHNPEFTSVELYIQHNDYYSMMNMTENLFEYLLMKYNNGSMEKIVNGKVINFSKPWRRISVIDELRKCYQVIRDEHLTEIKLSGLENQIVLYPEFPSVEVWPTEDMRIFMDNWCVHQNIECSAPRSNVRLLDKLIGHYLESQCQNPTFICEHPTFMCPLAKSHRSLSGLSERFELFIDGMEYVNSYTELNNPVIQRSEFQKQNSNDLESQPPDEFYCKTLEYGLLDVGGWGMGIDRLIMLLSNNTSIRDVIAFPTMKPYEINSHKI